MPLKVISTCIISAMLLTGSLWGGMFEADTFSTNNTLSNPTFNTVNFKQTFDRAPIVFVLSTNEGGDPSALRIRNVTTTGFEVAPVEPTGNDGGHVAMTNVTYFAIEAGRTEIAPGFVIDAGTVSTSQTIQSTNAFPSAGGYRNVELRQTFGSGPAVLGTIQTMNNETGSVPGSPSTPWSTVAVNNITGTDFDIAIERSEVNDGASFTQDEIVGYMAFQDSTGSFVDANSNTILWDAFISSDVVTGDNTAVGFNQTFTGAPLVGANKATRDGGDGGWVREQSITSTTLTVQIEEDVANDTERNHTTERISVVAVSEAFDGDFTTLATELVWAGGDTGSSGNWNINENWTKWDGRDANLVEGDILKFNNVGSAITTTSVLEDYTQKLGGLTFEQSTSYTINAGGGSLLMMDGATIQNDSSVAQTINAPMTAYGSTLNINAGTTSGGSLTLGASGTVDLSDTGGVNLAVTGSNNTTINSALSGAGGSLTKNGTGTLELGGSSANTYTGDTTVNDGTLNLNKTAGTDAVAGDLVVNGGTIAWSEDNQINDSSDVTLNGGTLLMNGADEILGTLTLTADSVIDFGGGDSILRFADSSAETWAGGAKLTILNWNGLVQGSGNDQLIFDGLTSQQLSQIFFYNPVGLPPATYVADQLINNEIVPAPEPSTIILGVLVFGILGWHERGRWLPWVQSILRKKEEK